MLAQSNRRVALAYASICHVGLAVLGLAAFAAQAVHGAVALLLSFAVATGGALLLLEFLDQRTGNSCRLNRISTMGGDSLELRRRPRPLSGYDCSALPPRRN